MAVVIGLAVLAVPAPAVEPTAGTGQDRPAAEQDEGPAPGPFLVIEVKGRLDRVLADFITESVADGARAGAQGLILQVNSPGSLLSERELSALLHTLDTSPVPVLTWVGHIGARAHGAAARLLSVADYTGVATKTSVGRLASCPTCPAGDPAVTERGLGPEEAVRVGLADVIAPNLGDFVVGLDGVEVAGTELRTARVVDRDDGPRLEPTAPVSFAKLDLLPRILHAIASPSVAYLLLVVGLLLILFEFFSVGIGIAGATGAVSLVMSAYGLEALGARPWGLALVALGFFGFAVDIQSGAARVWTAIGGASLVTGSLLVFPAGLSVPWLTLVAVLAGVALFVLRAMPAVTRARFSTSVVDRSALVGEPGQWLPGPAGSVDGAVALDRGGRWKARLAPEAERVASGGPVVVGSVDRQVLVVTPPPEGLGEDEGLEEGEGKKDHPL